MTIPEIHILDTLLYILGWIATTIAFNVWSWEQDEFGQDHPILYGAILGVILTAFSFLVRWYN